MYYLIFYNKKIILSYISIMNNNGVIEGLYICQQERTQQLNDRIFSRNIPSAQLQMQFSSRPVSTKYATMPILNPRAKSHIPINVQPTY